VGVCPWSVDPAAFYTPPEILPRIGHRPNLIPIGQRNNKVHRPHRRLTELRWAVVFQGFGRRYEAHSEKTNRGKEARLGRKEELIKFANREP